MFGYIIYKLVKITLFFFECDMNLTFNINTFDVKYIL